MGPYKCPDCGIWWAGFEHRCSPLQVTNTTTIKVGHCHGCSTALCNGADHVPCLQHRQGWTITSINYDDPIANVVSYAS